MPMHKQTKKFIDFCENNAGESSDILLKAGTNCMQKMTKNSEKSECVRLKQCGHNQSSFQKKEAHI